MQNKILAKRLKWVKVKPEVFEEWAYNAKINVLEINGKSSYYQVNKVNNHIRCTFWCGNQGMGINDNYKNYDTVPEAQKACQEHYNRIIKENCEDISQFTVIAEGEVTITHWSFNGEEHFNIGDKPLHELLINYQGKKIQLISREVK